MLQHERRLFLLTTLVATAHAATSACPCLTSYPTGVSPSNGVDIGGVTYFEYPSTYGLDECLQHDDGLEPSCDVTTNKPEWCSDYWCYVDEDNCNLPTSTSAYFAGADLHFSYSTCGNSNTFTSWFGANSGSGENAEDDGITHTIDEIVTVIHDYLISLSATLEDNEPEIGSASCDGAPTSCDCATCDQMTAESLFWTNESWTLSNYNASTMGEPSSFDFTKVTYTKRDGSSSTSDDAKLDLCLSEFMEDAFLRVAAKEADISTRVGYEYAAFQAEGNYVQWPATQWCSSSSYDARLRSWYVSAASGPKDVVVVIDKSGSMGQEDRMDLAIAAAKKLVNTFTSSDHVGFVKFSTSAAVMGSSSKLVQATDANKADFDSLIDGLSADGTTNFVDAFDQALSLLEASDGTSSSSGCTKAILFLSDGEPNEWSESDYTSVSDRTAALGGVHVFTYALGSGALEQPMKRISCENDGAQWVVPDGGDLGNAMADYYTFLAPLLEPCQVRWTEYKDWATGVPLLAACLATFKKETATSATSCNGGTDGCMPELLGAMCMDMSLIVSKEDMDARSDAQDFYDRVAADQSACDKVTPSASQLQALRARISSDFGDALCDADDLPGQVIAAPSSCGDGSAAKGSGANASDSSEPEMSITLIVVAAIGAVALVVALVCCFCVFQAGKAAAPRGANARDIEARARAPPQSTVSQQPAVVPAMEQMAMGQPVGQPMVAMGQAVQMQPMPYAQQPMAYAQQPVPSYGQASSSSKVYPGGSTAGYPKY